MERKSAKPIETPAERYKTLRRTPTVTKVSKPSESAVRGSTKPVATEAQTVAARAVMDITLIGTIEVYGLRKDRGTLADLQFKRIEDEDGRVYVLATQIDRPDDSQHLVDALKPQ